MKRKNLLLTLSLFAALTVAGYTLVSCGGGNNSGKGEAGDITYGDGSNFLAWLGKTTGEGDAAKTTRLDSGKEALLTSAQNGISVNGYDVPEGYELSYKATATDGGPAMDISKDGAVSVPSVDKDYWYSIVITGAKSGESDISTTLKVKVVPSGEIATGAINYSGLTGSEKEGIMEQLDGYTIAQGTAGVTLRSNGGYQLYSDRVTSPLLSSNNYIMGYGWGLDYGQITSDMSDANEPNAAWKRYYHAFSQDDPAHLNSMNSSNASTDDIETYIRGSYFNYRLNSTNTAKEQVGVLSRENDGIAVNMDANGKATKWKVKLRVGADANGTNGETKGLTYRTLTEVPALKTFDKRKVALDDYLTPWKLLLTQKVGWSRGSEQVSGSSSSLIVGSAAYYNATKDGFDDKAWANVGLNVDPTDNSINFEFVNGITQDFFAYYIDSYTSNPIPLDFIKALGTGDTDDAKVFSGAANYGAFPTGMTPVDTHLSIGPYMLEYYEKGVTYAFKKNDDWFETEDNYGRKLYQLAGYKLMFDQTTQTDASSWYKAFYAGRVDACTIPSAQWSKEKSNTKKKMVPGNTSSNLRLNTSDELYYEKYFGTEGLINRARLLHDSKSKYYSVKPIMSNRNFVYGLNTSINRTALCDTKGYTPSSDYYGELQQMSPASTSSYNSSAAHKDAVKSVYGENGISLTSNDAGYDYFEKAVTEELAAGHYKLGTGAAPTEIHFNIKASDSWFTSWYSEVANLWEKAFTEAVQLHGEDWVDGDKPKIVLVVDKLTPASNDDTTVNNFIFYEGQMVGDFDSAIGYITGGAYDTFNFMRLQRAYNDPAELVLTWGGDTQLLSPRVKYEGKYFSYDTLYLAGQQGVIINADGDAADAITVGASEEFALDSNNNYVGKASFTILDGVTATIDAAEDQELQIWENTDQAYVGFPDEYMGYVADPSSAGLPADYKLDDASGVKIDIDMTTKAITYTLPKAFIDSNIAVLQAWGLESKGLYIKALVHYTVMFGEASSAQTATITIPLTLA